MKKFIPLAASVALALLWAHTADARGPFWNHVAQKKSQCSPWHAGYYDVAWGQPVAVVVPPTAEFETRMGWGVTNTRSRPIWHQFERGYYGPYAGGNGFLATPPWPSHTNQFGDYYVRGPW